MWTKTNRQEKSQANSIEEEGGYFRQVKPYITKFSNMFIINDELECDRVFWVIELDEEDDDAAAVSSDELHKVSRRKKRKVAAPKVCVKHDN